MDGNHVCNGQLRINFFAIHSHIFNIMLMWIIFIVCMLVTFESIPATTC